jgi:hypothetical protein
MEVVAGVEVTSRKCRDRAVGEYNNWRLETSRGSCRDLAERGLAFSPPGPYDCLRANTLNVAVRTRFGPRPRPVLQVGVAV